VPHYVDSAYEKPYEDLPGETAAFFGVIANLDENVGRLITFLTDRNLLDKTIFVFMSDNGTADNTEYYNAGMRGRKGSLYDGGHRVPFYIHWPAGLSHLNRDISVTTHSTDLLPTLLELTGLIRNTPIQFDGRSLVSLIKGDVASFENRKLVIQYGREFEKWNSAVLWKHFRLINGVELYDLSLDPAQQRDISSVDTETTAVLREYYESWYANTELLVGRPNYIIVGSAEEQLTVLSSADWVGPYCGAWRSLERSASLPSPLTGYWDIEADSTGDYSVRVYLYPPEAGVGLNQGFRSVPAKPVEQARLRLNDTEIVTDTLEDATYAQFEVHLTAGEKYQIEAQFLDNKNVALWGAVYVHLQRLDP
jgi:hypothetical protein